MNGMRWSKWKPALGALVIGLGMMSELAVAQGSRGSDETPLGATMSGQTTLEDGAGQIEAKLLSGLAVKEAASTIVDAIGTDFSNLTVVVLPVAKDAEDSSPVVGAAGWDVLQGANQVPVVDDMVRVRDALDQFRQRHAVIARNGARACRAGDRQPEKGFESQLESITGVLQVATPLLNLFKQDFIYQGLRARVREGMLVTAVRGEIVARRTSVSAVPPGGSSTFREAVELVGGQLQPLPEAARCGEKDGGAETARAALATEFENFRSELSGAGSVDGMTRIDAAEDQLRRYGPRPATLVLAIDADGASMVQRKNLVTMFGAETTTVSSGVVVSYEFYEPQSGGLASLRAAGVLSCVSGAVGIRDIHKAKRIKSRATCF